MFFSTLLQHHFSKLSKNLLPQVPKFSEPYQATFHVQHFVSFFFKLNSYLLVKRAFSLNAQFYHAYPGFCFKCNIRNVTNGREMICLWRGVFHWHKLNNILIYPSVNLYHMHVNILLKPITIKYFSFYRSFVSWQNFIATKILVFHFNVNHNFKS